MVTGALEDLNCLGALLYDALHGALLNAMHQQLCEPHAINSFNWCFTNLTTLVHAHIMH